SKSAARLRSSFPSSAWERRFRSSASSAAPHAGAPGNLEAELRYLRSQAELGNEREASFRRLQADLVKRYLPGRPVQADANNRLAGFLGHLELVLERAPLERAAKVARGD